MSPLPPGFYSLPFLGFMCLHMLELCVTSRAHVRVFFCFAERWATPHHYVPHTSHLMPVTLWALQWLRSRGCLARGTLPRSMHGLRLALCWWVAALPAPAPALCAPTTAVSCVQLATWVCLLLYACVLTSVRGPHRRGRGATVGEFRVWSSTWGSMRKSG